MERYNQPNLMTNAIQSADQLHLEKGKISTNEYELNKYVNNRKAWL